MARDIQIARTPSVKVCGVYNDWGRDVVMYKDGASSRNTARIQAKGKVGIGHPANMCDCYDMVGKSS